MWLISESASEGDSTQGRVGLDHVVSGELQAAADHESVGWLPECAPKGAGEVCLALPNKCPKLRDGQAIRDMRIYIFTHLVRLPR